MDRQQALEMAEALTLDNEHAIDTLGNCGDDVAIALYDYILELTDDSYTTQYPL